MTGNPTSTIKTAFKGLFANKDYSEVISGTAVTMALKVVGLGLTYGFIYMLARVYGPAPVGVFNISITVLIIGAMVGTAGFHNAILRFSAQFGLAGSRSVLRGIYRKMGWYAFFFSLVPGGGVFIFSGRLAELFFKDAALWPAFSVIGAVIPFMALTLINVEAIRGLKKIKECEFFRIVNTAFLNFALFIAAVTAAGFSMFLPVATYGTAVFATFLFSTGLVVYLIGKGGAASEPVRMVKNREIFSVSLPIFAITLLTLIIEHSATLMLGYFSTSADVGIFTVAMKLSMLTSFILASINSIVAPKLAELYWNKRHDDLQKVISFASRTIFWTSVPVLAVFLIFPAFFMSIFGDAFREGWTALVILSIGQSVNAMCGSVGYFLLMTNGQRAFMNIMAIASVINITLCVVLIPLMGFTGAAISTVASLVFWNVTALLYIRIKYGISTFYLPFVRPGRGLKA